MVEILQFFRTSILLRLIFSRVSVGERADMAGSSVTNILYLEKFVKMNFVIQSGGRICEYEKLRSVMLVK